MNLIVDVRSREEYFKSHVKDSLNIPLFDLEYYIDFLKDKDVFFYCDTGRRARMAVEYGVKKGIKAALIPQEELVKYEREGKPILCAVNYLSVKPGLEEEFEDKNTPFRLTHFQSQFIFRYRAHVTFISFSTSGATI